MVGAALLLNGRSFIINGETVADEDAGKVLSDDLLQLLPSAMGNDAVERDLRIGENPEGVSGSADIPAGLVAVEDIAMADFSLQSLVFGSKLWRPGGGSLPPALRESGKARRSLSGGRNSCAWRDASGAEAGRSVKGRWGPDESRRPQRQWKLGEGGSNGLLRNTRNALGRSSSR